MICQNEAGPCAVSKQKTVLKNLFPEIIKLEILKTAVGLTKHITYQYLFEPVCDFDDNAESLKPICRPIINWFKLNRLNLFF